MADLRELVSDAKRLYEALGYLLEKQEKLNDSNINFDEIWFGAKARPIKEHSINTYDDGIVRSYLKILSGLIALEDCSEKRIVQIRFLARILASMERDDISLKNVIDEGILLTGKDLDLLYELNEERIKISLLVDLLIIVYLEEETNEKQFDYAIGVMALFGFEPEKVDAIGNTVKGILEQNDELVLSMNKVIDVGVITCYLKRPLDGVLVNNIDEGGEVETDKVIFYGISWEALSLVNIADFKANNVMFIKCRFKEIKGIENKDKNKKVIMKDCVFLDSKVEESYLCLRNAELEGCKFSNIKSFRSQELHLFTFLDSKLKGLEFDDIEVRHGTNPYGGILKVKDSNLENISLNDLKTVSDDCSNWRRVIDIYGGRVEGLVVKNGVLSKDSYLLTITRDCAESGIHSENIHSNREVVNAAYNNDRSASFDSIFKFN